jgi:hypothetical protein
MHPYRRWVAELTRLSAQGRTLPLGGFAPAPRPEPLAEAGCALLFSPHPDDECLTGALPLRLLREARMRVADVAVTLGSKPTRQAARLDELRGACAFLGFDVIESPGDLASLIARERPRIVLCPHARDAHPTHMRTHGQVMEALARQAHDFSCVVAFTEYWSPLESPNLLCESSEEDVGDLVAATSFHAGEVLRNPYHLMLPARMQDDVRRGCELVGGTASSAFAFGTLYRLERWDSGRLTAPFSPRALGCREAVATLL